MQTRGRRRPMVECIKTEETQRVCATLCTPGSGKEGPEHGRLLPDSVVRHNSVRCRGTKMDPIAAASAEDETSERDPHLTPPQVLMIMLDKNISGIA